MKKHMLRKALLIAAWIFLLSIGIFPAAGQEMIPLNNDASTEEAVGELAPAPSASFHEDVSGGTQPEGNGAPPMPDNNGKSAPSSINVDAEFLYGLYNNMASTFSIIQGLNLFAYQFNADFKRSSDFGYDNSSYYDNSAELMAQIEPIKTWTLIPSVNIHNESHGMFNNLTYSREEKDRVVLNLKNEYKPTPTRLQFNGGYTQYVHQLIGADTFKAKVNKFEEDISWERVFAASHTVSLRNYACQYFYSGSSDSSKAKNDFHNASELIWSIKLFEYLKLSLSPMFFWNMDTSAQPGGRVRLDSDSLKFFTFGLFYSYSVQPFKPEDLFFTQNYIMDNNSLPPEKVHTAEFQGTFSLDRKSESNFYLSSVRLKTNNRFIVSDNFYNYIPSGINDIITIDTLRATSVCSTTECMLQFTVFSWLIGIDAEYTFSKYNAKQNITYRPEHLFAGTLSLDTGRIDIDWKNEYRSSIFTDNIKDTKLSGFIIGTLAIQLKIVDSVSINMRMNNLYNTNYRLREGYPEPGFTVLGGVRIII